VETDTAVMSMPITPTNKILRHHPRGVLIMLKKQGSRKSVLFRNWLANQSGRLQTVDLDAVVSKYINETGENLGKLFAEAESKGVILLFDEADALFSKRTGISEAHDKYANQEISLIWRFITEYRGTVVLCTSRSEKKLPCYSRMKAILRVSGIRHPDQLP
jgi:SpoVK/Ycf46/Vps4 family AAA+-type ATPase